LLSTLTVSEAKYREQISSLIGGVDLITQDINSLRATLVQNDAGQEEVNEGEREIKGYDIIGICSLDSMV